MTSFKNVIDYVLVFLLLTLNIFPTFFEYFYKDFEQGNVSWSISFEFREIFKNNFFIEHLHITPPNVNGLFSKCEDVCRCLWIWTHLLTKSKEKIVHSEVQP